MEFGASHPSGDGTAKIFFDKQARRKLRSYAGAMAKSLEHYLDVYMVMAHDDCAVTVAYRTKRIRRA